MKSSRGRVAIALLVLLLLVLLGWWLGDKSDKSGDRSAAFAPASAIVLELGR